MANRPERIGKYEITDDIGGGGMGKVYKARDPRMRRTVAIKVIKGDFSAEPEFLKRFDIEAQALASLVHPNIVVVYDLGDEHGSPYLVMEYLDGIPLDKVIAQRQSVPIVQKLGIVIEILNALHYAHQRGIIHRDVKPANVMVLKDGGHVKLLDFGIAREGDLGQTKTGQLMGTEWYMSPEVLNSETADPRSDVYAAGILLYEVLAYALPFDPRDRTGMIVKRLRGDPPPPLSKYLESYPLELDEIIARALTVSRDQRYSTAEEFAFDLTHVQDRLKRDVVSHHIDQARAFIERSDLIRARELLSEVIRIDTQNQTAKQLLSEIFLIQKKSELAGKVKQLQAQAADALSKKQLETAENLIEQAIKLDRADTDLHNLREQIELAKARAQQVKKLLTLAKVAQQTGELAVAKKAVEDALKLDPQDTDARLMGSVIARLMVDYEKQRQIQQFLQAARREVEARQFTAAQENIAKAKAIDATYPEIAGLERMLNAGREQDARQRDLAQLRSQVEQELSAGRARAARDIAAGAMRKFPGEQDFVRLKSVAEAAIEKEERRAYIDERIATASRLIEGGEASRALRLLKDVEREYAADTRLRESIEAAQQAVARETASREKQQFLRHARSAMRVKTFSEAIRLLEAALVQFPEDFEIKDLLKTARDEFDLLSKKKQVEEVSKHAQNLLQSRAHTDAIRLLERTVVQVADPELINLLEYARREAANFRAGVQDAIDQATQMLNLGQPAEAVTFLEAQADKYGKNADFQVLLEQARKQAKEAERAKQRLLADLAEARTKLRAQDTESAERLLRVCELENANDPEVLALAVEIEEEKKAGERRQAEADQLAQDKAVAERRRAEAERLAREKAAAERLRAEAEQRAQEKAEAERREQDASREREGRAASPAPGSVPASRSSFDNAGATLLDGGSERVSPAVWSPSDGSAAAVGPARAVGEPGISATQLVAANAGPAVQSGVLTPPPIEVAPAPAPALPKKGEPRKKRKGKAAEAPPVAAETVIKPGPEKALESAPLAMQTIVPEPRPVAPPRRPEPPKPLPVRPPDVEPPDNKRLIFIAGGAVAIVVLPIVAWFLLRGAKPSVVSPKAAPTYVRLAGGPAGASYQIGSKTGYVGDDGTAMIEEPPGVCTVNVDKPGYEHFSKSVKVTEGNTTPVEVTMAEIAPTSPPPEGTPVGTLVVGANVDHFDVFVNGRPRPPNSGNSKQVKIDNVPEDSYTVMIKRRGYQDSKEQRVRVVATKETKSVYFSLNKEPEILNPPTGSTVVSSSPLPNVSAGNVTPPLIPSGGSPPPPPTSIAPKLEPSIKASAEPPDIEQGKSATIRWSTQNVSQVMFEGRPFDANGHIDVTPDTDTTYTLIAKGSGWEKTERVTVRVHAKIVTAEKPITPGEKPAIMAALEMWRSAYASLNMASVRAAFPNIPPDVADAIQKLSKEKRQISVQYSRCSEPRVLGETAEMQCTEAISVIGGGGAKAPPKNWDLKFVKQGDKWVLNGRN